MPNENSKMAIINQDTLKNIANSIRNKTETTEVMYPSEMSAMIDGINVGGGVNKTRTIKIVQQPHQTITVHCTYDKSFTGDNNVLSIEDILYPKLSASITADENYIPGKINVFDPNSKEDPIVISATAPLETPETIEFTIPSQNVNITKGNGEDYYYKISATGPSSPCNDIDSFTMALHKEYGNRDVRYYNLDPSFILNQDKNSILFNSFRQNVQYKLKEIKINNIPITFNPYNEAFSAERPFGSYIIDSKNLDNIELYKQYYDTLFAITGKKSNEISSLCIRKSEVSANDVINDINQILNEYMRRFYSKENDQPLSINDAKKTYEYLYSDNTDLSFFEDISIKNIAKLFWFYSKYTEALNVVGEYRSNEDLSDKFRVMMQKLITPNNDGIIPLHIIALHMYPIFKNKISDIPEFVIYESYIYTVLMAIADTDEYNPEYTYASLYEDLSEYIKHTKFNTAFILSNLPETLPNEHPEMKFVFKRVQY